MADKIQVAVRVRPVLLQKKDVEIHWSWSKGMVFQSEPGTQKRIGNPYLFDQVFGTEAQNYQIFTKLVEPLIDSAMNGFNVTVLAYGQTASGKTYTMMGSQKELGIVQLAVERIFALIEQHPERAFLLRCSYIEIYNETISDLLSSNPQKLKVQELAEGHVVVHNLIETNVNTPDAVLKLMQQGNKQRRVGGTSMNERSSRSHTIFRIIVESVPRDEADRSDAAVIVSHINLVDLAGSEKASQTHATGDRFREGCAINTSLSALSLVIKQLSEGEGFVNFRDSKLTHILRASLGGNALTAIICNVTPTVLDETSSTLKFACSAKAVQNQPHVNEVLSDQALLRKYNNYIKDLEKKLKEKELEKKPEAIEEMQRLLQEKDMKINELKEQLVVSSDVGSGRSECSLTIAQRSLRRMTWGGNRLKQVLNLPSPAIFEGPPVPSSERVPRTMAHEFASRQRTNNISQSEMVLDEVASELENLDSETFFPAEIIFSKSSESVAKVDVATMTDVKESPFKLPCVPSTPVPVLRERLQRMRMSLLNKEKENEDLREELEDLTNFTRLEQDIGVHVQATAKNVASPESADHLHRALQTANDMEVLYLDTQRKLSELQTEFKTNEAEHEKEIYSIQTDYKLRLETEVTEKKRLAKELIDLRDKFDRLEKDHSEADTHVQVISERHAKREADLRETLQEAWTQLELLGQDPNAIKENSDAKKKLVILEQEILEMQKCNSDAQSRIVSLTEELRRLKESAPQIHEATVKDDDQMHDNSLNGMCLTDELRDVFMNQECSFVSRSVHRTRKRPSSILSFALAKMDQSACVLDSNEQEIEPSKKTRLSISDHSEELAILEVKEIREYLVELQAVLERYEADYEVLSQEKELLNSQLINAQKEVANLREEKNKAVTSMKNREEEISVKKFDTSEDMLDSSCFICEPSISTSIMDMEQSCESEDQFLSLRDQFMDTRGSSISVELSEAAAQKLEKVENANKIKQLEEELAEMNEKLQLLQQDVEEKTNSLEQKQRSLVAAQSTIKVLEQRDEERQNCLTKLDELNEKMCLLSEDSTCVTRELETTRQTLNEIHAETRAVSIANKLLESQLEKANNELESASVGSITVDRVASSSQIDEGSDIKSEKSLENLSLALDRVKALEYELELKTAEVEAARNVIQQASSKADELEQISFEKVQLEELVEKLTSQLDGLQDDLDLKVQELNTIQEVKKEAVRQKEFFDSELEKKKLEINHRQEELIEARLKLESTTTELITSKEDLKESCAKTQELVRMIEQLEIKMKEVITSKETIIEELRIKSDSLVEAQMSMEEIRRNGSEEGILQDLLDKSRAQVDQLKAFNEELLNDLDLANTKINDIGNDLQSTNAALSAMKEEIASRNQEYSAVLDLKTDELKQISFEKIQLEELIEKLTSQLDGLQDDLDLKIQELSTIQEVRKEVVLQKKFFDSDLEVKKLEVDKTLEELAELRLKLESTTTELITSKEDLKESCAKTQELVGVIEQLKIEVKDSVVLRETLQEELRVKSDALVEAERSMEEIQRNGPEEGILQDLLNKTRAQAEQLKASNEERLAELNLANTKINDLENDLQSTNAALFAIKKDIASRNQEHSTELEMKTQTIQELEKNLIETNVHLKELQFMKEVAQNELDESKRRIVDLEENLESECDARVAIQRAAREAANIAAATLQSNVEEKEKIELQLIEYRERVSQLTLELDHSTSALQAAKAELFHLEKTNRAERVPREDLDALNSELKETLQKVLQLEQSLEDKTVQLNVSYQKLEAHQARIRILEQKEEDVSKQMESFESSIQDLSAQKEILDKMVTQFQSDLQSKETELVNLRSLTQKVALLESRLQDVGGETTQMSRIIDGKTDEIIRLEEELARVTNSQTDHQKQLQHAEQRLHERQRELDEIRNSLQSMQSENDGLIEKLSEKENLNGDLRKNVEIITQRFDLLHSKFESVQSDKSSLSERVRFLESQLECQEQEIGDLRRCMSDVQSERDLSTQLKHRLNSLQTQYDNALSQCQQLGLARDEMLIHQEKSREELLRIGSQLQVIVEEKTALEQYRMQSESQKETILRDYQTVKNALIEKENQLHIVQCQRDEFNNQVRVLNDRICELQNKASAFESKFQVPRQLEETVDKLKKELFEARSKIEIVQLNFETEEDHRKKRIERLEKELEVMKQQYAKCKEQLRLQRYQPNEEGTINLPKPRISTVVESIFVQTDPIADKGFGFRWQMEQYVSDNERLRKKVSDLGERMEFYKDKLIKYRNLYFQITGQDSQRPSSSSSNHSSQPMERHSSSSSNSRENVADCPFVDSDRNSKRKTSVSSAVPASIIPQPVALQETPQEGVKARITPSGVSKPALTTTSSTRWSGGKKESLTKEEMEKINNCNPS